MNIVQNAPVPFALHLMRRFLLIIINVEGAVTIGLELHVGISACEELALEQLHSHDGEDELEDVIDDQYVEDLL